MALNGDKRRTTWSGTMIDNNYELTIGELDAVTGADGSLGLGGIMGEGGVMGMLGQIKQTIETTLNPTSPPTQDPAAQAFQQAMNGMRPA